MWLTLTPEQKEAELFSFWGGKRVPFDKILHVGKGWHPLIEDLVVKLIHLGWTGELQQVKEKFGGLRFYFTASAKDPISLEIQHDVAAQAEARSYHICEECGEPGRVRSGGWALTLCRRHAYEQKRYLYKAELQLLREAGIITEEEEKSYPYIEEYHLA